MNNKPKVPSVWFPARIAWCAHVTVTPEDSKTRVFNKGTPHGDKGLIPIGGQVFPSSTVGASLLWKKAQKKAKKKHTSDTMNKTTPTRSPRDVFVV